MKPAVASRKSRKDWGLDFNNCSCITGLNIFNGKSLELGSRIEPLLENLVLTSQRIVQ